MVTIDESMQPTDAESIAPEPFAYSLGDVKDDDGAAIDSYFEADDTREDTSHWQDVSVEDVAMVVPQRIIVSTGTIAPGASEMVLPADVNRAGYQLLCHATGAARPYYMVSSSPDTFTAVAAMQAANGDKYGWKGEDATDRPIESTFIPYNGPLYIWSNVANLSPLYYIVTSYTE